MGNKKLSFETGKEVAICDYIREHAAEISFLRFPKDMKVTKFEGVTLKKTNEEQDSFHVRGILRGDYPLGGETMSEVWHFSCNCRIKRGLHDEPVVYDLTQVSNEGSF